MPLVANKKIIKWVKKILPSSFIKFYKKYTAPSKPIVYNLGLSICNQPKVFFSYIHDFLLENDSSKWHGTRDMECAIFLKKLISSGCRVDMCNVNCINGIRKDYDYIFGQGEAFRKARKLNPRAKAILYLTEKTPEFSLHKEKERINYLNDRHGLKVKKSRTGSFFKEVDFIDLYCCIMIGCERDCKLLPNIHTYLLRPTGLINEEFNVNDRNIELAKKHFLWIGSFGAVHKGLDILFDVFRNNAELTLHVAGLNIVEKRKLSELIPKNVIDHGYMNIKSEEFQSLANQCAFVAFASCSEGMATSVITAMNHGLIPLITEESSIEIKEIGEIFKDFKVETIDEVIKDWSKKDNEYLKRQMEKTIEFSKEMFSLTNYANTIQNILSNIIKQNDI